MPTVVLAFKPEKATKNTVKYMEQVKAGEAAVIGPLYVQKAFLGGNESIDLTVTLTADVPTAKKGK